MTPGPKAPRKALAVSLKRLLSTPGTCLSGWPTSCDCVRTCHKPWVRRGCGISSSGQHSSMTLARQRRVFRPDFGRGERWPHRHEVLSLAFMDWIAPAFDSNEQAWAVAAIVSHHKDAEEIASLYPPPDDPDDDQLIERVAELAPATVQGLWRWLTGCAEAWIEALGLQEAGIVLPVWPDATAATAGVTEHGVKRIYYWLKVYRRFVKMLNNSNDREQVIGTLALRGHIINSDHSASAHAGDLPRAIFDGAAILASRRLDPQTLFNHQIEAWATKGSALLTAPTGSGKTEAALLWAAAAGNRWWFAKAILHAALPSQYERHADPPDRELRRATCGPATRAQSAGALSPVDGQGL